MNFFFCERSIKGSFEKLRILLACFFTGNFCTFVFAYIVLTVTKVNYHFKEKKTHFITENFVLIRIWRKKKSYFFFFYFCLKGRSCCSVIDYCADLSKYRFDWTYWCGHDQVIEMYISGFVAHNVIMGCFALHYEALMGL